MGSSGAVKAITNVMLYGASAFALMSCAEAAAPTETEGQVTAEAIMAKPTLEGAHSSIQRAVDQGNPRRNQTSDPSEGIRRAVVELVCPPAALVTCGAEGTKAAAIWLAAHGGEWGEHRADAITDLIINVGDGTALGGFQLFGKMPTADALAHASQAEVLEAFHWNGAGEAGEIAVAKWCDGGGARQAAAFCSAFFEDECTRGKAPEVVKACPAALLNRAA